MGAAIVVYKSKDHASNTLGGLKRFRAQSITIQSPVILKEIKPIMEKYGLTIDEKQTFTVLSPFKNLFFSHSKILQLYESHEEGSEERTNLRLLVEVMKELFRDLSPKVEESHAKGLIDHNHLWTLFPSGILVYMNETGQDQAYEVLDFSEWVLRCRYVSFNGTTFMLKERVITIEKFEGMRRIDGLVVYPLSFHADPRLLEENLERRGRVALNYQGISFKHYIGSSEPVNRPSRLAEDDFDSDEEEVTDRGETLNSTVGIIYI